MELDFHKKIKNKKKNKVLLRICGGLGNQVFQLGYAYSIAKNMNCRLDVNTSYQNNFFSKGQTYSAKRVTRVQELLLTSHPVAYIDKNESFLLDKTLRCRVFRSKIIQYLTSRITKTLILDGYFQSEKDFSSTKSILSEFQSNLRTKLRSDKKNRVGLHVRAGDLLNQPWNQLCTSHFYERSINKIVKEKQEPIDVICENAQYAKYLLRDINAKLIFLEPNDLIIDFLTLASYKNLICANSSFSWWAAILGIAENFTAPPYFYKKNDKPAKQQREIIINY